MGPRRDPSRRLEARLRKGAIAIPYDWKTEIPGVFARHADDCPVRNGRHCTCGPLAYRAGVREWETNRRVLSPDFSMPSEAQAWLREQRSSLEDGGGVALDTGDLGTPDDTAASSPPNRAGSWPPTPAPRRPSSGRTRQRRSKGPDLDTVIRDFLREADAGGVDRRLGEPYAFESLLDLRGAMSYVDDELRTMPIADVRRRHIQKLVDDLRAAGLPSSIVLTVVDSLRGLYAFAIQRDLVDFSPVVELGMPAEDDGPDDDGTWSHAPAPPPPPSAPPPPQPPPVATVAQPAAPPPPPQAPPSWPTAPPQPTPYGPDWQYPEAPAGETAAAPTAAMLALGGRVMTWTTRLALIAFALLVLVLARELGLTQLIR